MGQLSKSSRPFSGKAFNHRTAFSDISCFHFKWGCVFKRRWLYLFWVRLKSTLRLGLKSWNSALQCVSSLSETGEIWTWDILLDTSSKPARQARSVRRCVKSPNEISPTALSPEQSWLPLQKSHYTKNTLGLTSLKPGNWYKPLTFKVPTRLIIISDVEQLLYHWVVYFTL